MGVRFNLDQASLVGWLTRRDLPRPFEGRGWGRWPDFLGRPLRRRRYRALDQRERGDGPSWRAPRASLRVLRSFLSELPASVVTSFPEDFEILRQLVSESRAELKRMEEGDADAIVPFFDVARILAPLRRWFDVPFYFMPLGRQIPFESYRDSTNYTMWLQCGDDRPETISRDLLDPFPPLKQLFTSKSYEPATVCWTWSGETVVILQKTSPTEELLEMVRNVPPWRLWRELELRRQPEVPALNILQLSDLHFGATSVTKEKLEYVEEHLRGRIDRERQTGGVVQPIVTGDLMDDPSEANLKEFSAFRERLSDHSNTPVVCIPGNHDIRKNGYLWKKPGALADLEWQSVVSSDVCKVVFVCFDSSRDADLAQGRISDDQFLEVATKLTELRNREGSSDYIRIALVHHHPFSTRDDEIDTLPFLAIREERFLRMENGDQLVRWCGGNGVPLILHGHKHRPRFIGQEIEIGGHTRLVRAVGCGASFGIEGKPLSFNWITWQPATRHWTVSYFADPGDGSGFQEKRLVIGAQQDAP